MSDTNLNVGVDLKLSELLDNLSAKLGVAVDKLEPLAKDTLDQYALRETVYSCSMFLFAAVFIFLAVVGFKMAKNAPEPRDEDNGIMIAGVILCALSALGALITLIVGITILGNAVAPLPSILGL